MKYLCPALALAFAIGPSAAEESRSPRARQPNIILIITDDQGYGDLRVHGNSNLDTPNIDRLAHEGCSSSPFMCPQCARRPAPAS